MAPIRMADLRRDLARVVNSVAFGKERVVVERHGKPLVAVVPLGDLELIEKLEDHLLAEQCERILSDPEEEWIPWEQAKAELRAAP
ncbi:MAG: type II toxin-antitoxin system Phd/YefM family antitoxin [Armatimonadetes bacterium]|nr:type II toxin-antitoxin system Phd/YefM family antitoxin [Armatimonadota bacterium]